MKWLILLISSFALLVSGDPVAKKRVGIKNFVHAETLHYFQNAIDKGALTKFHHIRTLAPIDDQGVVRMNRDTLYSQAVLDLDAGPVTLKIPPHPDRYMSVSLITEEHHSPKTLYDEGTYVLDKDSFDGFRYGFLAVRTFVDARNETDVQRSHELQDALVLTQDNSGHNQPAFEPTQYDNKSLTVIREGVEHLLNTAGTLDSPGMFGPKDKVDPLLHFFGAAGGWGGLSSENAIYEASGVPGDLHRKPMKIHLNPEDVPIEKDGFWSVTVYDHKGRIQPNKQEMYVVNNLTAVRNDDGSVDINFGKCNKGEVPNCLPTYHGWNYLVRMYRPKQAAIDGTFKFPKPEPREE